MAESIRQFAIVGLGKMGANLAENALQKKYSVAGIDPKGAPENLKKLGLKSVEMADIASLPRPRFVMLYVPAGPLVDTLLDELAGLLEAGDIVADGGNSYWGDSIRRHARMKEKGIAFIDAGTSGGAGGALDGACFMIGGEDAPERSKGFYPRLNDITVYAIRIARMTGKELALPDISEQWPAKDRTKSPNAAP